MRRAGEPYPLLYLPAVLAVCLTWATASHAEQPATARPVLLELYTSQSCSSCPPADALLGKLAQRQDVLALSFHVDYWNQSGWVDRDSAPAFTERQNTYSRRRGLSGYTPEMVVDGQQDAVGWNRWAIEAEVETAKRQLRAAPADIVRSGPAAHIRIGKLARGSGDRPATVYLLSFDPSSSADIRSGENAGRSVVYTNVVRSVRRVGSWSGETLNLDEPLKPEETGARLALVVQDDTGMVWAVASSATATAAGQAQ